MQPSPRYDRALVQYIKIKQRGEESFSTQDLSNYLYYQLGVDLATATEYVADFMARRAQATTIIQIFESQRRLDIDKERDALIALLRKFARRAKQRSMLKRLFGRLFILLIFGLKDFSQYLLFFGLWIWSDPLNDWITGKKRDLRAMRRLIKLGGIRSVGVLAEATCMDEIRSEAENALIDILPELKASDAPLFNAEQRKHLYTTLERDNKLLIITLLKALEQSGDENAIPYVERLAAGEKAGQDRQVRQAAQECLPFLRMRAAAHKESQMLLRPSASSEVVNTPPNTLLRPAQYNTATEPEQLLRASTSGEE